MSVVKITPYIFFNGNASAALEFYQSALGAEVSGVARYGDMPPDSGTCAPENKDQIMNATVKIGEAELMCSDRLDVKPGGSGEVQLTLYFSDGDSMARAFDAMSQGGVVNMPIHDAFWGDTFGALKDRFGIGWQFIHSKR